jgi:hypothetical protein
LGDLIDALNVLALLYGYEVKVSGIADGETYDGLKVQFDGDRVIVR